MSRLLWFATASLLMPTAVAFLYAESCWWAFALPALLAAMVAFGLARLPRARQADTHSLRRREGFLAVVLGWVVLIFFTSIAYVLTGEFDNFADCIFESTSGFTTTGATVVEDVESLPRAVLFMRSFSHWIGGMGIIVLSVAILPQLAVGGMQLFAAESSGIAADKLAPRIADTARRLWFLYVVITALLAAALWLGPMSFFDAVNHAMATIATGGFSTKNASIAAFDSLYAEIVVLLFMFLSAMSFSLHYRVFIQREPVELLRSPEARWFAYLSLGACLLISADLYVDGVYDNAGDALRYGSFQTISIITTTGFGTADFDQWPHFSRLLLVGLMLIGGCAGSTAGGSKVVRFYVVVKYAGLQLRRLVRPRLVDALRIGEREVGRETTEGILGFYLLYFAALMVGGLALTALGLDLVSGTSASVSAMNSIGPGLGTVGAVENFSTVPDAGLYVLSFGMLLGRLEIYTVLVLFTPHFWRRG